MVFISHFQSNICFALHCKIDITFKYYFSVENLLLFLFDLDLYVLNITYTLQNDLSHHQFYLGFRSNQHNTTEEESVSECVCEWVCVCVRERERVKEQEKIER